MKSKNKIIVKKEIRSLESCEIDKTELNLIRNKIEKAEENGFTNNSKETILAKSKNLYSLLIFP